MLNRKRIRKSFYILLSLLLVALNIQPIYGSKTLVKAASPTPEEQAASIVQNMTLEEKIGQMFMPDFRNWNGSGFTVYNDEVGSIVKQYHLGGIILFGPNVVDTEQTVRLADGLQGSVSGLQNTGEKIPLMLSIDQEGGAIVRLATGTNMPGNMALGATNDPQQSYKVGKAIGEELKALGINVNFAPVLDVNVNPFNPVIGVRSFGGNPQLVASMGKGYVEGIRDAGIASTGKHFPGHGDTATDSHLGLPVVTHDLETVHNLDLVPFQAAINDGIDMIMTAHVVFPAIDDSKVISTKDGSEISLPATLSHKVLTDLLRTEMGFKGVITTDALNMAAIADNFGKEQAVIMAIKAGSDIVLMPAAVTKASEVTNLDKVFKAVLNAVQTGEINEAQIDQSAKRIITLKLKRGIYNPLGSVDTRTIDQKIADAKAVVGSPSHKAIETEASNKSVTLVKNDNNILPFNLKDNDTVVVLTPFNDRNATMTAGINEVIQKKNLQNVAIKSYTYGSSTVSTTIKQAIDNANYVILGTYGYDKNSITPGYNYYTTFPRNLIAYNSSSKNVPLAAVAICAPYDIMSIPNVGAYVAVYGRYANTQNLVSGMRAVFGLINPTGKLPVDIPDGVEGYNNKTYLYKVGYGLSYPVTITMTVDKDKLQRNDTANISLTAAYKSGITLGLTNAEINYFSSNPDTAAVQNGIITAKNTGTSEVYASVKLDGITTNSNILKVEVYTSVGSIRKLIETYEKSEELFGPLVPQLNNSLTQAEKFFNEMKQQQAVNHMEDFVKLLNNPPMDSRISTSAKDILNSDANALIKEWSKN
jgi:beta-N-acetylhexosaminidase